MNLDPSIRKLVQVAEEANTPIHVPVVLGNECFIVTQQDVRKIEDSRIFSYSKMNAKGEIVPLAANMSDAHMREALLTAARYQIQNQNAMNSINMNLCGEMLARAYGTNILQPTNLTVPCYTQCLPTNAGPISPLTPEYLQALASLQQQVEWARANQNTLISTPVNSYKDFNTPYPMHHTTATSTTEINSPCTQEQRRPCCTRACNTMEVDVQNPATNSSAVSARQQAKQRKMVRFAN